MIYRQSVPFKFYLSLAVAVTFAALGTSNAKAACTGANPTWTSTPDSASVASCVSNASNGSTINVTAGNATWSSRIIIANKAVNIIGAGAGSSVINSGGFTLNNSSSRISGFTFNWTSNSYSFVIEGSVGWRIDHNTVTYSNASDMILAYGQSGRPVEGLFDNNNVTYGRIVYYGDESGGTIGNNRWAEPLAIATSQAIYVEDNTIRWLDGSSGGYLNHMDGNWGCRYVARFNTIVGGRFEAHALQGFNSRGCRLWEIYNNVMTNPATPGYRPFLIRAGTGMIFHNTTDGRYLSNNINIDNPRSEQDDVIAQMGSWGACDGNSWIDGNTSGGEGYPCRDQIGRSTDSFLWNMNAPASSQSFFPAYIWKNVRTDTSVEIPVALNCVGSTVQCTRQSTKHIVESRDFYTYRSSFNGTSGVGEGTIAQRPSGCTPGVGFWATDQGEWNSKNPGADGALYKCTAPNTWSLNYTPYTYPHPLQGGSAPPPQPAPPTSLTATGQ